MFDFQLAPLDRITYVSPQEWYPFIKLIIQTHVTNNKGDAKITSSFCEYFEIQFKTCWEISMSQPGAFFVIFEHFFAPGLYFLSSILCENQGHFASQ